MSVIKAYVTTEMAANLAAELFNVVVDTSSPTSAVKEFASYDDRNFYIRGRIKDGPLEEFVLKISNFEDSQMKGLVEESNALMLHLHSHGIPCSYPHPTVSGKLSEMRQFSNTAEHQRGIAGSPDSKRKKVESSGGETRSYKKEELQLLEHAVRLYNFMPGKTMRDLASVDIDNEMFYEVGRFAAKVSTVLKDFKCSILKERDLHWDLKNLHVAIKLSKNITDPAQRKILRSIEKSFKSSVEPILDVLPKQCIHGDINEGNLIIKESPASIGQFEITGLIDFGDVNYSCRVFELAIVAVYMAVMATNDPIEAAARTVAGFQEMCPLTDAENDLLVNLMQARLCQSICFGATASLQEPDNAEYLLFTSNRAWKVLDKFAGLSYSDFNEKWHKLIKFTEDQYLKTRTQVL